MTGIMVDWYRKRVKARATKKDETVYPASKSKMDPSILVDGSSGTTWPAGSCEYRWTRPAVLRPQYCEHACHCWLPRRPQVPTEGNRPGSKGHTKRTKTREPIGRTQRSKERRNQAQNTRNSRLSSDEEVDSSSSHRARVQRESEPGNRSERRWLAETDCCI